MLLPLIILGGVTFGIATPTEATIFAVAYALILGTLLYGVLSFAGVFKEPLVSAKLVSLSLFCLGAAAFFGWLLAYYNVPKALTEILVQMPNSMLLLMAIALVCLILGMILDALIIAVIIGPLFLPAVLAAGIDPVHYGIVACVSLSLGLITPPYGLCLLLASSIGKIEMHEALGDTIRIFISNAAGSLCRNSSTVVDNNSSKPCSLEGVDQVNFSGIEVKTYWVK
jgi:tripartite ATP-independent transporter DctM subunit